MLERNHLTPHFLFAGAFTLCSSIAVEVIAAIEIYELIAERADEQSWSVLIGAFWASMLLLTVPLVLLAMSFFLLGLMPISRHHSVISATVQFSSLLFLGLVGSYAWRRSNKATLYPVEYQNVLLLKLLRRNGQTEYGRRWNFAKIQTREQFRNTHPLTTYDDYRPYIDRIADGEQNLLTRDKVEKFNVSSGTTGKCKLLPSPSIGWATILWDFFFPYLYLLNTMKSEPYLAPLKSAFFMLTPRWRYTEKTNIPIGPASGMTPKQRSRVITWGRTVPLEVSEVYMNEPSQLYVHWLFALLDGNLARIDGMFAGSLLSALDFLQSNWPKLADDVRHGRVTIHAHTSDIPKTMINQLIDKGLIWADPLRAAVIEAECSKGFEGIVTRLWPRIRVITACTTGAHFVYVPRIRFYVGPNVTIYSAFYGASEGVFGWNMDPLETNQYYTLQPQLTFFEFIAEEDIGSRNPPTLFIDQLQIGKRYELVITSLIGFYRYRMGDLIEIASLRHGKTPVIAFCSRVASILDLRGEKTSEDMIFAALTKSWSKIKGCTSLGDFTTTEGVSLAKALGNANGENNIPQGLYYVLFVEFNGVDRQLSSEEVKAIDDEICEISYPYKSFRTKGSIDEPHVVVVKPGTFLQMREIILTRNQAISNQYKTPRYLTGEDLISFLWSSKCC